jgi:hypothetical protein
MTEDGYPYDAWVSDALQGVLKTALRQLASHGFTGDHHFYINFDTTDPAVRMPGFLRAQYPEEITIFLQHQFDDLLIEDDFFEVTLGFSGQKQRLHIPFDAVKSFADPSVNFILQIGLAPAGDAIEGGEEVEPASDVPGPNIEGATWRSGSIGEIDRSELEMPKAAPAEAEANEQEEAEEEPEGANVITLDQFRK